MRTGRAYPESANGPAPPPAGPAYWRSLAELAGDEAFREALHREFPDGAASWDDPVGRRRFLKLMGASLTLAGLHGCTSPPQEEIVPYVEQPEEVVPGRPLFFATAFPFSGYAEGILVENHMGRPTKVEGNPDHPASRGAASTFAQASVLDLYDPDRSQTPRYRGALTTWEAFLEAASTLRAAHAADGGAGLRLLTETITSPTLAGQIQALLAQFPRARWIRHDPVARDHAREGLRQATGRALDAVHRVDRADVVLTLDADFLAGWPGSLAYARAFADRRRVRAGRTEMNRLYAVESTPTLTGAMADHRLPLRPGRIEQLARALASLLGYGDAPPASPPPEAGLAWLNALVRDLEAHRGGALIVAGETLPPSTHALVHALNEALGNVGRTVDYIDAVEAIPPGDASLRTLVRDMEAGAVQTLVMLGGNPAYTAPVDVPFAAALPSVPTSIHLSPYVDETSARSVWHLPQTHYLEAWSDARAYEGTATVLQPLIAPLYADCRSAHEVLAVLTESPGTTGYGAVRRHWQRQYGASSGFAGFWQQVLHDGVVPGTSAVNSESAEAGATGPPPAPPPATDALPAAADARADSITTGLPPAARGLQAEENVLEIVFRPDPTIWDGRFANNAWLQELPAPLTKLVWDNAALISPALAAQHGLENEQVVVLAYRGREVEAPVWIVPGHADGAVTLSLGHGRTHAGRAGNGTGVNAYRLRTADAPWGGPGLTLRKTDARYPLVTTQHHHSMEGRHLVEAAPIATFRENPDFVREDQPIELPSLYPEYAYTGYKWGMVIDVNVCTGCNACITACQAENNIPVVGKEEVARGREMHWLRVDRYYEGDAGNPATYFQPVPCMHCEKAPCELVCPVYATVHDREGLNVMVYNRCIGTRYCSNNCPYKVRRFNFLQYADWDTESLKLQRNPDVTVRSRGVMEKCTYCVQRISAARIRAKRENRKIRDREVLTACQMTCPTEAITFGDLNDPAAEVTRQHGQPHNYSLLRELGTHPRTTYLARFRNPNPDVPAVQPTGGDRVGQSEQAEAPGTEG